MSYLFIYFNTFPRLLCLQQDVKQILYIDKINQIIIGHYLYNLKKISLRHLFLLCCKC